MLSFITNKFYIKLKRTGNTQLLYQLLYIYKIYKIYTLKHKKRSDMFRS